MCKEPKNEDRAARIATVMHEYCQVLEGRVFNDDDGDIVDMLADVMHFCNSKGFNFEELLRMAQVHFEAEKEEGS